MIWRFEKVYKWRDLINFLDDTDTHVQLFLNTSIVLEDTKI